MKICVVGEVGGVHFFSGRLFPRGRPEHVCVERTFVRFRSEHFGTHVRTERTYDQ